MRDVIDVPLPGSDGKETAEKELLEQNCEFTGCYNFAVSFDSPPTEETKKAKKRNLSDSRASLGPNGGIYFNRRKNGRLIKHVVLPKILKNDIRRDYATIFRNVFNSGNESLMKQYLMQYCRPDSMFRKQSSAELVKKGKPNFVVSGMSNIITFWSQSVGKTPDIAFDVGNVTNLRVRSDGTAVISFQYQLSGTRLETSSDESCGSIEDSGDEQSLLSSSFSPDCEIDCQFPSSDEDETFNALLASASWDDFSVTDDSKTTDYSCSNSLHSHSPSEPKFGSLVCNETDMEGNMAVANVALLRFCGRGLASLFLDSHNRVQCVEFETWHHESQILQFIPAITV
eukprot:gene8238-9085_t